MRVWHTLRQFSVAVIIALCVVALQQNPAQAAVDPTCATQSATQFFELKPWNACFAGEDITLEEPSDIWFIVYPLIEDAIKVAGYLAVGLIIWGGVKYTKSQGNPQELTGARTIILNAIIGLIIAVISTVIVQLVVRSFVRISQ